MSQAQLNVLRVAEYIAQHPGRAIFMISRDLRMSKVAARIALKELREWGWVELQGNDAYVLRGELSLNKWRGV